MSRKPAFLLLALALGLSPLLSGVASADGGHGRGHDSHRNSYGRHDYGYDRYDHHQHAKKRHGKHYKATSVVYRDRPRARHVAKDSLTIFSNGRSR
mgnify:CR=1 FL=1